MTQYTKEEIKNIKKNSIELKVNIGDDIEPILRRLVEIKEEGYIAVYANINGHKFYSVDADFDRDFKIATGHSLEELKQLIDNDRKAREEMAEREAKDAIENLDNRINAGNNAIIEEKHAAWEETVRKYSKPPYYLGALDTTIKYLEELNEITPSEAAQNFHQEFGNDVGDWYTTGIIALITRFSQNGPEFIQEVIKISKDKGRSVYNNKKLIKEVKDTNKLISLGLSYEEATYVATKKLYSIALSDEFKVTAFKTDDNLYQGITQDGRLAISTVLNDDIIVTYVIDANHYTRYITKNNSNGFTQISNDINSEISEIKETVSIKEKRNVLNQKLNTYVKTRYASTNIMPMNILNAYQEISELDKPLSSKSRFSQVEGLMYSKQQKLLNKAH